MKTKFLVILGLTIMLSATNVFADTDSTGKIGEEITPTLYEDVTPVLISAPIEEIDKEGFENIRGYIVSYENQTLTIKVQDKDYNVTVYDKNNTFAEQLKHIKEKDFIELNAEYGEATFYLSEIKIISPIMNTDNSLKNQNTSKLYNSNNYNVLVFNEKINYDVEPQLVDGKVMIPLRLSLEKMGYEVNWNQQNLSVDIKKGTQFTSIYIGKNSYYKNKMAPIKLSFSPILIENRTLVPIEFFSEILNKGVKVENDKIEFLDGDLTMAIHRGFIHEINYDSNGNMNLVISEKEKNPEMWEEIIIHTSNENTILNKNVSKGMFINVVCPPIMTMSIPGQTSANIIY